MRSCTSAHSSKPMSSGVSTRFSTNRRTSSSRCSRMPPHVAIQVAQKHHVVLAANALIVPVIVLLGMLLLQQGQHVAADLSQQQLVVSRDLQAPHQPVEGPRSMSLAPPRAPDWTRTARGRRRRSASSGRLGPRRPYRPSCSDAAWFHRGECSQLPASSEIPRTSAAGPRPADRCRGWPAGWRSTGPRCPDRAGRSRRSVLRPAPGSPTRPETPGDMPSADERRSAVDRTLASAALTVVATPRILLEPSRQSTRLLPSNQCQRLAHYVEGGLRMA